MNYADGMSPMAIIGGTSESEVDLAEKTIKVAMSAFHENLNNDAAHLRALIEIETNRGLE